MRLQYHRTWLTLLAKSKEQHVRTGAHKRHRNACTCMFLGGGYATQTGTTPSIECEKIFFTKKGLYGTIYRI